MILLQFTELFSYNVVAFLLKASAAFYSTSIKVSCGHLCFVSAITFTKPGHRAGYSMFSFPCDDEFSKTFSGQIFHSKSLTSHSRASARAIAFFKVIFPVLYSPDSYFWICRIPTPAFPASSFWVIPIRERLYKILFILLLWQSRPLLEREQAPHIPFDVQSGYLFFIMRLPPKLRRL